MNKVKRIVSFVLALLLAMGTISLEEITNAYATENDNSNSVKKSILETKNIEKRSKKEIKGDGWKLSEEGVFTLLANIDGKKYYGDSGFNYPWRKYAKKIKEVVVAEGVTKIPNAVFSTYYTNLKKVTMSSTVRVIQGAAFAYNPNLTEINLNDGLKEVGVIAFVNAGIKEIKFPKGVKWGSDVFCDCKNLESVTIPAGSKWARGSNAQFYGCDNLKRVIIKEGVTFIPTTFLTACYNLKYIWIPKSVTELIGTPFTDVECVFVYKGSAVEDYIEFYSNLGANWAKEMKLHYIDGDEHTFGKWQTVKKATYANEGLRVRKCICGKKETKKIQRLMLPAPTSVKARLSQHKGGYDDVVLSWNKVKKSSGYYIYHRNLSKTNKWSFLARTTKTSYTKKNLVDGAKYQFKVVPYYLSKDNRYKSTNYKSVSIYTLKKMSTPSVKRYNQGKVKIIWNDIAGQSGYQISKSTSKNKINIVSTYKTTNGKSKVIKATKKKGYYYKVRAYKYAKVGNKTYKVYAPWSTAKYYKLK